MSLEFKKVDDILTDETREELMDKHNKERAWIKQAVMDMVAIAQNGQWDYDNSVRLFDAVAEVNEGLNSIADVMFEYSTSYSILLEKYNKIVKQLAETE